jgi:phosphoribosyl-dephospho-CoA transferase
LIVEDHVTGWLAMVWTSLALVPMKRLIIVFPFVAEKESLSRRWKALRSQLMPCIRNIEFAACCGRKRRHCSLQLVRLPGRSAPVC